MSRLLFAAARGARIQKTNVDGEWRPTLEAPLIDTSECAFSWRIHPDDLHLQYGPISTKLREAAADGQAWDLTGSMGRAADAIASYDAVWWYTPLRERSLYLLILAEALADEGL